MTPEEIAENEQRNGKFQQLSIEAEIIPNYLKPSDSYDAEAHFMSATDVIVYLGAFTTLKLNKVMIGRAMPLCGFRRVKDSTTDRYGYWCLKLK